MNALKTNLAMAALAGLLAIPAAKTLFAADDQNNSSQNTSQTANEQTPNTLSDQEKAQGWKLLFDGKDFEGWHSFHRKDVRPGWKVEDGTLACVDPHNAGGLVHE